ncbi:sulfatase [Carboxylicivirga sediminis]|uniref:Sulfatase n=1 Tax=Carboxylicivirga sediminis TaxID=2006564 RepID=A0A941IY34_9BACT|nr:sulfatase [Carboxylicivirga sediminis]MBR8536143.1 sulfatase [Carboxylicivirga sediminis]
MKLIITISLLLLITSSACVTASNKKKSAEKAPNILFIAIDDMNDWTGFLGGHPQAITPNMDKLAAKGVNFTNAHCSAPGCSPSRNALLYGVEPFNSGLYPFYEHDIHEQLMDRYITLPRLLKEHGYNTYGAGKIHHGLKDDPREWTGYFELKYSNKEFKAGAGYQVGNSKKNSFRPTVNADDEHVDYQVASYGVDILQSEHDKPFFLAVGIVKPHLPFDCPERFFNALPEKIEAPAILEDDLLDIPAEGNSFRRAGDDKRFKNDKAWEDVRRAYLACISWADYNIGRVLDALEASPYADNTIVVLWSDHGFHLGEKMSFKKFTLWEEATRVPFIIYDGREKAHQGGQNYSEAVSLINIYRTLAELSGIEAPGYVDGESLVPVLKNTDEQLVKPTITSWGRGNYAVRTKDWRYIRYFDGTEELYHHKSDANEWHNLANDVKHKKVKEELAARLPKRDAETIQEFISPWSVYGVDKEKWKTKKK